MAITTLSSHAFQQDASIARKAANAGPVFLDHQIDADVRNGFAVWALHGEVALTAHPQIHFGLDDLPGPQASPSAFPAPVRSGGS